MIYTNIKEEKFDLKKVLFYDEVDIIFGESTELLNEIAHAKGRDRMQIIIRNFIEDQTDSHWFSMKFIPARNIKNASHDGRKGIPIVFERLSKKIKNETIYYPSPWKVYLGGKPDKIAKAQQIMDSLTKKEIMFIDAVVDQLGLIILEYWELDPNDPIQYNRLREIQKEVESQYIR